MKRLSFGSLFLSFWILARTDLGSRFNSCLQLLQTRQPPQVLQILQKPQPLQNSYRFNHALTLLTTPTMLTKLTIATISLQFPSGGSKKQCVLGHAVHDVRTVRVVSTVRHCVCMIVGTVSVVCAAISVPQRPTASHKAIQRPSTPYSALQRHKSKTLNNLNLKQQTNPST